MASGVGSHFSAVHDGVIIFDTVDQRFCGAADPEQSLRFLSATGKSELYPPLKDTPPRSEVRQQLTHFVPRGAATAYAYRDWGWRLSPRAVIFSWLPKVCQGCPMFTLLAPRCSLAGVNRATASFSPASSVQRP